mmetsp:Transcript_30195/g.85278  ORF Transcript_30195/g.85278 Transcript_30195/m.85278 type:complete len:298 (-) Transcript_30195:16-909(-)|eukprot:CAMPEP_0117682408 /NCGR_PEP_ID=MMETSP0804-20121206/19639_1 /TAXON_ID=1074897 /ORGANISM="Tetraselmis astigmatica, Strain CCMP880" /LENGTH=297 /DNA_ID=CAMNT_0005492509 /DNA_START=51 /DNA_END=944 /DNA_ORIENTATION=-
MEPLMQTLLAAVGLADWKQMVWEHAGVIATGLVALLLLPLLLSILPGIGDRKNKRGFLDPETYQDLLLAERKDLTHNTRWFRFALPKEDMALGLPVGQHISLQLRNKDGKEVARSYTPVSGEDQLGFVDFVIKIYPQGEMTPLLDALVVGDKVGFRGPKGKMEYKRDMKSAIGMIAGGTGITPMYQVLKAALEDEQDRTQFHLIFANVTADDILLKEELDAMVGAATGRLSVFYVLNECPPGWEGGQGFVTEEMIKQHLPAPAEDIMVCRCGPPPMNAAMRKLLDGLGYPREAQFQF